MVRKRFFVERVLSHLREAEVLLAQGRTVGDVRRGTSMSGPFEDDLDLAANDFALGPLIKSTK